MSTDVTTVTEDCPVVEIAELFERRRIERVPVTRDGKIVGIVGRTTSKAPRMRRLRSVGRRSRCPRAC